MRTKCSLLKGFLSAGALLLTFFSKGQQLSSLVPPPPEAAAFFKSTDIPVSAYTGLPNIGVDFYTIKTKELQIPIRLNYNARGIQVAEVASRTGIGWALQYGGMISRQIRGCADELPWGLLTTSNYNQLFTDSTARFYWHENIINHSIDEFPDQFYFDVNGLSGKFIFDHNDKKIIQQQFSNLRIIPQQNSDGFVSWLIIDQLGNKYYYGRSKDGTRQANDYDQTSLSYSYGSWDQAVTPLGSNESRPYTAWHLMEIETYLGERIEFFYEEEMGIQYRRSYDKIEYTAYEMGSVKQAICYFSQVYSIQHQIQEIRFPGGKVQFEKEVAARQDYTNTHALKKLVVKDGQENVIKGFEFNYFYQRCLDDQNQLDHLKLVDPSANYRLFLASIKELGSGGASLPPYQFEYNTTKLPNRFSNSQDNWGYYNGAPNGRYLTFYTYLNAINRRVQPILAGAGLLEKITYPTGGSALFTYEQNQVLPPPFIKTLLTNQNNPVDTAVVGDAFYRDDQFYANGMYSKEIVIGDDIMPNTTVEFSFVQFVGADPSVTNYQVWLERLDSTYTLYLHPPDTVKQLPLPRGRYLLKVVPTGSTTPAFIAGLRWTVLNTNPYQLPNGEWFGAGQRIRRIEHRNGSELVSVKEYEYQNEDSTTSGKMFGLPNFYYIQPAGLNYNMPVIDQYGSLPGSPLFQLQGNSIGYARVTEYNGTKQSNQGKTVFEFTTDGDGGDYYKMPYHLPNDMEWIRGKPITTQIYKRVNSDYELLKTVENKYLYNGVSEHSGFLLQPFVHADLGYAYQKTATLSYLPLFIFKRADGIGSPYIDFKVYHLSAGTMDLDSTIEREYTDGGELVKITKHHFNYAKHYLPAGQSTLTSKGHAITSSTQYVLDKSALSSLEQLLLAANRVALPLRTETVVKNAANQVMATSTQQTVINAWPGNLVLPEKLQSAINAAPFTDDVTYTGYNMAGGPQELTPKSGVKEVYLWGYKGLYPVAKVVGSDYTAVANLVDTLLLEEAANYSEVRVREELQKIRTGLANTTAQVFTYTYKPLVGMTSATDPHGRTLYYEYDGFNRLSLIRDEQQNILKKYCYNYQGEQEACGIYVYSSTKSGVFTKQCDSGGAGSPVTYTVTKTSTISQEDADQKALADVAANGQAYANQTGSCTWSNDQQQNTFTKQCSNGGAGSTVTYTVAAGTYSSQLSKADANQKAQNDINQNGQAYANSQGYCTWTNDTQSGTYFKQCSDGGAGSGVTYTVMAGKYSSTLSKADANQKALNEIAAYGQNHANTYGYCTWINDAQSGTFYKQCPDGGEGTGHSYTIGAGIFSSTVSKADANQKAINALNVDGQNYANAQGACRWLSDVASGTFTKQCTNGGSGSMHTYTVPAGTYASLVSKYDANQKAEADVSNNGQAYANNIGTCTWYNDNKSGNYYRQNCPSGQAPQPYYVSVPANSFSSTLSKEDANAKAVNYAQSLANQNGTCVTLCSTSNCNSQGEDYKCVNGQCERGVKVFTDSYYDPVAGGNVCIYHYEWSDGSWSQDYSQFSGPFSCNVGGGPID